MSTQNPKSRYTVRSRWKTAREWIASPGLRRVRLYLFQGYVIAALIGFSALALLANTSPVFQPDVFFTRELQSELPFWMGPLMQAVSVPGYAIPSIIVIAVTVIILGILGLRWEAISALFAAFGTALLNFIVKVGVRRPRPTSDLVNVFQNLSSYSFPSGHVMFYTAFFGFLLFLTFILLKYSLRRTLLEILLGLLILLVGISRMYLGEHWASDVLAGYLLGSLVLIFGIILYRWGKDRYLVRQPVAQESASAPVPHEEKKEIKEALKNPMMVDKEQVKKEVKKEENKEVIHDEHHPDRPTS